MLMHCIMKAKQEKKTIVGFGNLKGKTTHPGIS